MKERKDILISRWEQSTAAAWIWIGNDNVNDASWISFKIATSFEPE